MRGKPSGLAYSVCKTSKGWLAMLASPQGLRRLTLPQPTREQALATLKVPPGAREDPGCFADLHLRLQQLLAGKATVFPDALDLAGATPFQQQVWQAARTIPWGQTQSYGWVAQQIGKPKASRAVGQAMGQNPVPLVVPCHRVLAAGGRLGGYGGGEDVKLQLLRQEGITVRATSRQKPAPRRPWPYHSSASG